MTSFADSVADCLIASDGDYHDFVILQYILENTRYKHPEFLFFYVWHDEYPVLDVGGLGSECILLPEGPASEITKIQMALQVFE
jgi:hypothetical protein